jgi:hypothetical protein
MWVHAVKHDGLRVIIRKQDRVKLYQPPATRSGSWQQTFSGCVVLGEIPAQKDVFLTKQPVKLQHRFRDLPPAGLPAPADRRT